MPIPRSLCLALTLLASLPGQGAVPYLEIGAGRRQGDFGTSVRSDLWLGYASLGCAGERWDSSLTVPFLSLQRTGPGVSRQDWGLGDVVVQSGWRFLPETWDGWSLDGLGALKCPTANQNRDLGTGRADLGTFLALNQRLGLLRWSLLGGWIQGVSGHAGGDLTPGAYAFSAATSLALDSARWELVFEARGPAFQGEPGAREVSLNLSRSLSPVWGVKASAMAGFTAASPKWSVGLALVRSFP